MLKRITLLLLASLLLAGPALAWWGDDAVKEEERFERTVAVVSDVTVEVDTINGGIDVTTWDRDEVEIIARKKARGRDSADARQILADTEILITENAGRLSIRTDRPERSWRGNRGVSVSYELRVPRGASLDAESTNGGIEVSGLDGEVRVDTTNGSIRLDGIGGPVEADTTNGAIKAYDLGAMLDARTTNGGIYAEIRAGRLSQDMALTTTNGSVELKLSPDVAATIDARVSNGSIKSDLAIDGTFSKKRLSGDLNGGGPRIEMKTSNGRIRIGELH